MIGIVGIFIGPRSLKSPRMIEATFNSNSSTTIISSHSPTNASNKTNLDVFYNEPSSLDRSITKHSILIIGGDMNSQIGKNVNI